MLRKRFPHTFFLVPGYGAQGAGAAEVIGAFDDDRLGAIVNASRSLIFAYRQATEGESFATAAGEAARRMRDEINSALQS